MDFRKNVRAPRAFSLLLGFLGLVLLTTLTLMLPTQNVDQLPHKYLPEHKNRTYLPEDKTQMKVIIHLDLKGAPPKIDYYFAFFKMLADLKVDAVLIEYEDMFPYNDDLSALKSPDAYTVDEIAKINELAQNYSIKLIPLVQTFGHLEFALKHSQFARFRENPLFADSICPSDSGSLQLIEEMVRQIRSLHPTQEEIHLGADEAYHVAEDQRCRDALEHNFKNSTDRLKLNHIANIAKIAHRHNFTRVYVWNDMFGEMKSEQLLEYKLNELVVPMVWGYIVDVTRKGYFPEHMFHEYAKVFPELVFASAFKGANGIETTFMEGLRYLQNLQSYHTLQQMFADDLSGRVHEIALTGWQRYKHGVPLCELLPVGIPVLVEQIAYIRNWSNKIPTIDESEVLKFLNYNSSAPPLADIPYNGTFFHPPPEWKFLYCEFPGVELYRAIEELRFARWKASINPSAAADILLLEPKLREELSKIYSKSTVEEWIAQNLYGMSVRI